MPDAGLSEFKEFSGFIQKENEKAEIKFSVRIDKAGEVEFDFGTMDLSKQTSFIFNGSEGDLSYFSLWGASVDGTEFRTENLLFNNTAFQTNQEANTSVLLAGSCTRAEFIRKLAERATEPLLRMHIKGFRNFRQLNAKCPLGTIAMHGPTLIDNFHEISGFIAIQAYSEPHEITAWHTEADNLLEHIRRIMSFATAAALKAPVVEFYAGDIVKIIVLSQSRTTSAPMRIFHHLDQQPIFDAAVNYFFNPPIKVNNLFFAIEWFAMEASYSEVRLVNAMTAIENLVASNLDENDSLIRPKKEFENTRRLLRKVLRQCIAKWSYSDTNKADEIVSDINEKLADLNRRSIIQKIITLSERWSVPLDDIGNDKIKAAKQARDLIVHRGHYSNLGAGDKDALWQHVTVVREIVVRFLLTALGYRGQYFSYMNGCHESTFPPKLSKN